LDKYQQAFSSIGHRSTRRAAEIVEAILQTVRRWYERRPGVLLQGHGDFNPKNILIGYDNPREAESCFIAVIDFDKSFLMPAAFVVGTFLAQYRKQFFHHPGVLEKAREDVFITKYLSLSEATPDLFLAEVELFRARADMSIAYYLIKVGLGDSEDLWRVLVDADRRLAHLAMERSRDPE
jgi:Ser/Thr protein kinase RdoA (MazF antagonist)